MKRLFSIVSAALLTGALAAPVMAQSFQPPFPGPGYGSPGSYAYNHPAVTDFNHFFDSHPEVARELSADPHLIDNPNYLRNHPELRDYLWSHPLVASAFRSRPDQFVRDEHVYNHLRWDREHHRWYR